MSEERQIILDFWLVLVHFTFTWELDGREIDTTAYTGDFFFLYLKVGSSDFTEDDLAVDGTQVGYSNVWRLEYGTTYYWQVKGANVAADMTDSGIRSFTTVAFKPPAVSTRANGTPTGENNMVTVRRLVAVAQNKFWYEDVGEV